MFETTLTFLFYFAITSCVLLASAAFIIVAGVKHRQNELAKKTGNLDLTGKEFRRHLAQLNKTTDINLDEMIKTELPYDPRTPISVQRFRSCVGNNTHCPFAKASVLWGTQPYDENITLEENIAREIKTLILFLDMGKAFHLDGLVIEVSQYGNTIENFGDTVRRVLTTFSDADPHKSNCMRKSYIDKFGWWFEFNNEPIFVTTFAPCYPVTSSRYQFCNGNKDLENSCYVLFQPEYSFGWRNIECFKDPVTEWNNPVTLRDKIRVEYKKHGRCYEHEANAKLQPTSYQIVPPLRLIDPIVRWWLPKGDPRHNLPLESPEELEEKVRPQWLQVKEVCETHS